jgi:nucleoside-diphosphate-sugar epimerase
MTMKIFLAGATGALGRQLVPQLLERGHDVTGMTSKEANLDVVARMGATPALADALDPEAVGRAVSEAEPEVIVHQLTALSDMKSLRNMDKTFATTNRLRTEGTDHLVSAGRAAGIKRFVAQSYAGWPYERTGSAVKSEEDPIDPHPAKGARESIGAIRHLERVTTAINEEGWATGTVLRYGGFYGPGTSFADANGHGEDGMQLKMIRKRMWPVIGDGEGMLSLIHVADAASATVKAIEGEHPGVYNIADDEPVVLSEWLPATAEIVGAPAPRRIPKWVGRVAAGELVVLMSTEGRGASNAKAKRELGWKLQFPSWRKGFAEGLA